MSGSRVERESRESVKNSILSLRWNLFQWNFTIWQRFHFAIEHFLYLGKKPPDPSFPYFVEAWNTLLARQWNMRYGFSVSVWGCSTCSGLYNPILERQILLQFLQTKSGGAGADGCCPLRSVLSPHCSSLFPSLLNTLALTVCLQPPSLSGWCHMPLDRAYKRLGSIIQAFQQVVSWR